MTLGLGLRLSRAGELPVEVTGFVGRRRELAELAALVHGARLVTVTGPGGVGKTRISLRLAARIRARYAGGARLAELSGLRDPELLAASVATALGVPEQDDRSPLDTIIDYLSERELLLILDTCEHLVDACATLADLVLRNTIGVTILATSRQPLGVPGERTYPVPPLPVPSQDAAEAGRGDAVELFVQRAGDVVPGFAITQENRGDVLRLCRRLDGIPLAIELATVRLRAVPIEQLSSWLENRFQLLTGERRTALPRHQTLGAAIEWSYELCTPAERQLWARLSVFAGTFDIAAAEDVCPGEPLARADIVHALIDLVDKSIVLRASDDRTRYRLLDTVREFGAEKLADLGQAEMFRARHVARYLAAATWFGEHFRENQLAQSRALRREHANIRAALEYALSLPGHEQAAARLAAGLYGYWQVSGLLREGRYWLTKVLDRLAEPSSERAWALIIRGYLGTYQGAEETITDLRSGIAIAGQLGDALAQARGYAYLTLAFAFSGRYEEATVAAAAAQKQLSALDDTSGLVSHDTHMACLYNFTSQFDRAIARCEQGLRRLAGYDTERWGRSYLHMVQAHAHFYRRDNEQSLTEARAALVMKAELSDYVGIAFTVDLIAWLAAVTKRYQRAALLLGAADALWNRLASRLSGSAAMEHFRRRAEQKTRDALGPDLYQQLWTSGASHPLDGIIQFALDDADELPPSPAQQEGTTGHPLTAREREIAALVTEGLSNRDIAQHLMISKRTVDAHLEHIFAKLDISSRTQLAAWQHGGR